MTVNWDAFEAEAVHHLQALVRLDTSNPPGNERPAAEYLVRVLTAEGLEPCILESAPGRANLVVRLKGRGAQPPLMLLSHLDVVPAGDAVLWTHPPFSGALVNGQIWGRGALDDKPVTVADLMTVLLCHRLNLPLRGDLTLLAHADEESDFTYGMAWLVRHHRDLFDAPWALYEGGAELTIAGQPFCLVDTAEKGWCTVQVTTRGPGGHSSQPHADNALFHMADVLQHLATRPLPIHHVDTVSHFLGVAGDALQDSAPTMAGLMRRLADPTMADTALAEIGDEGLWRRLNAMLRNTATPTLLTSGHSPWALPTEARLTLNGRLLPGQTAEDFDRELRAVLGPAVEYQLEDVHMGTECPRESPVIEAIRRVMGRHAPGVPLVANLMTGGTERGLLHDLGVEVYGFCPLRETPDAPPPFALCHAPDERVMVSNLVDNCHRLFEVVCEFNQIAVS